MSPNQHLRLIAQSPQSQIWMNALACSTIIQFCLVASERVIVSQISSWFLGRKISQTPPKTSVSLLKHWSVLIVADVCVHWTCDENQGSFMDLHGTRALALLQALPRNAPSLGWTTMTKDRWRRRSYAHCHSLLWSRNLRDQALCEKFWKISNIIKSTKTPGTSRHLSRSMLPCPRNTLWYE